MTQAPTFYEYLSFGRPAGPARGWQHYDGDMPTTPTYRFTEEDAVRLSDAQLPAAFEPGEYRILWAYGLEEISLEACGRFLPPPVETQIERFEYDGAMLTRRQIEIQEWKKDRAARGLKRREMQAADRERRAKIEMERASQREARQREKYEEGRRARAKKKQETRMAESYWRHGKNVYARQAGRAVETRIRALLPKDGERNE